jgi:hypothetical protein
MHNIQYIVFLYILGVVGVGQHSEDRFFAHLCLGSFVELDDFN